MLTRLICATLLGARPARNGVLGGGVALTLLVAPVMLESAAAGAAALTCFRTRGSLSCVGHWGPSGDPHIRQVPGPRDPAEEAAAAERERRWAARCRPVIRQDQYGVARYHYAAAGCEYGVIHD